VKVPAKKFYYVSVFDHFFAALTLNILIVNYYIMTCAMDIYCSIERLKVCPSLELLIILG